MWVGRLGGSNVRELCDVKNMYIYIYSIFNILQNL